MIDVHAPHEATHTWTDFFIHIATIVLGLIIAVGLEEAVEYVHHRHQVREAREQLRSELENNHEALRINIFELLIHEKNLRDDLGVLHRLRTHSFAPGDRLLLTRPLRIFTDAAWKNAVESGTTAYLAAGERNAYSLDYLQQDRFSSEVEESHSALDKAAAVLFNENTPLPQPRLDNAIVFDDKFTRSEQATEDAILASTPPVDVSRLTPAQIDLLELGIQEAIAADERLLGITSIIQRRLDQRLGEGAN
jgi:hypothetical protein